jgi:hypothetical protein
VTAPSKPLRNRREWQVSSAGGGMAAANGALHRTLEVVLGRLGAPPGCWRRGRLGHKRSVISARRIPSPPEKVDAMFADEDAEQRPIDEHLDRESGVFIEPDAHEVTCEPDAEPCAPDDYVNDPAAPENGIPGTVDDVPLTFGVEAPSASDNHLVLEGATKSSGKSEESEKAAEEIGKTDEGELWGQQVALVEEDEIGGLNLNGFPDEEIPEILDAMGDDAADPLQDFPNGVSATGEWSAPEHGGFPERED